MTKMFLPAATDFTDIPVRTVLAGAVVCPKCHGFGKWNLLLNEYGPGRHFQQGCGQCNGWGAVAADGPDTTCIHDWRRVSSTVRGQYTDACIKCPRVMRGDSSD